MEERARNGIQCRDIFRRREANVLSRTFFFSSNVNALADFPIVLFACFNPSQSSRRLPCRLAWAWSSWDSWDSSLRSSTFLSTISSWASERERVYIREIMPARIPFGLTHHRGKARAPKRSTWLRMLFDEVDRQLPPRRVCPKPPGSGSVLGRGSAAGARPL